VLEALAELFGVGLLLYINKYKIKFIPPSIIPSFIYATSNSSFAGLSASA
jgi:hypothetical protein